MSDLGVSHVFVPRRDRVARPDNPIEGMTMELGLRQAGLTMVYCDKVAPAIPRGAALDIGDLVTMLVDFKTSGAFRRELAQKLLTAKVPISAGGFSVGGEPLYGFRRWLCTLAYVPVRELHPLERVKFPGHHVLWLATAAEELAVVRRIVDRIQTTSAAWIARELNEEGIPSPRAGRTQTGKGDTVRLSGLWTGNSVRNIAVHPRLVGIMEYGRTSSGDQMRYTPTGPRPLDERDFDPAGRLLRLIVPEDQRHRTALPASIGGPIDAETHAKVVAVVAKRGESQRGKPRARGGAANPLGGRVFDMGCGWPMYRYTRGGKFSYTCSLYQNSEAKCCQHNTIDGGRSTRLALAAVGQLLGRPEPLARLRDRMRELSSGDRKGDDIAAQRKSLAGRLAKLNAQIRTATRNMALAGDEEQGRSIEGVRAELVAESAKLESLLAAMPATPDKAATGVGIDALVRGLSRLTELATGENADHRLAAELFVRVDLKFYAKFAVGYRGKRKILSLAGGVLTLGNASPPVPLYDGPTDRPSVQKRLALGESVSHVPKFVAPGSSAPDPDAVSSANPKSVTRRCSRRRGHVGFSRFVAHSAPAAAELGRSAVGGLTGATGAAGRGDVRARVRRDAAPARIRAGRVH